MAPPIVYDGVRLFLGALSHTPRGVDRVDLSYARFLCESWPNDVFGLLPTPWGVRLYDRQRALRMLESVEGLWRENQLSDGDAAFSNLRDWLEGGRRQLQAPVARRRRGFLGRGNRFVRDNGLHLGHAAVRAVPQNAVYLNIGQLGWAVPVSTQWLRHRTDVRPVFMLHDVIPLQHPDLVSGGGRMAQDWMLRAVIRRAAGLITTTDAASHTVMSTLREQGLPEVPVCSLHLPVAEVFVQRQPDDEVLRQRKYFVICGAIEPRKNHLLLLRVWHRLVGMFGAAAPRLVIAGTPAHQGAQILQRFLNAPALRDHVIAVSGLASPSLRQVMANATAVLMPSLAEGFGLPVIESLTVGTPVLASDLPVHREVGGDMARYLDPADDAAWAEAIGQMMAGGAEIVALRSRIAGYVPLTTADYFRTVGAFLAGFA